MKIPAISVEAMMVLDAIAEQGSYARAAESLNKVPSALSYIVQKLEEQLDVTLFQREGRRAVLTPAGKFLLAESRHLLFAINKISEQTKTIANGWEPKIRIAFDTIIDMDIFLPTLKGFLRQYQNIEIDIREESLNGSWESLLHDEVDLLIGVSGPVPQQKGISALPVGTLNLVFCVAPDHPLAQHQTGKIAEETLSTYRTIIIHDSAKTIIPKTTPGVITQSQHLYVSTFEQKLKVIKAGLGGGYMPKKRVQSALDNGELIALSLDKNVADNTLYIAWKIVNKGKGLQQLRHLLTAANLADNI